MPETIGERLQRLRQQAGMSQSALATAAEVPIGSLRNWEQDRRMVALDAAGRLAVALGVSLDALAGSSQFAEGGRPRKAPAAADDKPAKKKRKGK